MRKQIYLHVPEPCHENWNVMTPVEQGRFCQSCCKQVTDFSKMTDSEILTILSKSVGKTCGRFSEDQLQRPVVKEIPALIKPYKFFLSAFIPAFLLANNSISQEVMGKIQVNKAPSCMPMIKGDTEIVVSNDFFGKVTDENNNPLGGVSVVTKGTGTPIITNKDGKFRITNASTKNAVLIFSREGYTTRHQAINAAGIPMTVRLQKQRIITMGLVIPQLVISEPSTAKIKVADNQGEPLPFATIKVEDTDKQYVTNSKGLVEIELTPGVSRAVFTASHAGYITTTRALGLPYDDKAEIKITLANKTLDDVVVKSYLSDQLSGTVGGLSYVTKVSIIDTARTFVTKAFKNELFRIYPNPVGVSEVVNLVFKHPGNYAVQVFNNAGSLFLEKDVVVITGGQVVPLRLPALARGSYFIKATHAAGKKKFIDKFMVQ